MVAKNGAALNSEDGAYVNGAAVKEIWHNGAPVHKHESGGDGILPTGIAIPYAPALLKRGRQTQLSAVVSPADAADKRVHWASDNPSVATVSANGLVTGNMPGHVAIAARTANGITATATIQVVL